MDYFAPKPTEAKPPLSNPRHSPSQLLGLDNSESEDQLARKSSSDSLSSQVIFLRQNRENASPNQAATAETRSQNPPSNAHDPIDPDGSQDDDGSSDDESEDEHHSTTRVPNTAAPVEPQPSSPAKMQSSTEALNKAFEIEDDGEPDSESDSESESLSSEVMIVRSR